MTVAKDLNESQLKSLILLNQLLEGEKEITEEEKTHLGDFITKHCKGNMEINVTIYNAKESLMKDHKIKDDSLHLVLKFTFHTRSYLELEHKLEKISETYEKLLRKEKIDDSERLTFKEYAILRNLHALRPALMLFLRTGITELNPELKVLHDLVTKIQELEKMLETRPIRKELLESLRSNVDSKLFDKVPVDNLIRYFLILTDEVVLIEKLNLTNTPTLDGNK